MALHARVDQVTKIEGNQQMAAAAAPQDLITLEKLQRLETECNELRDKLRAQT